jgi:tRNA pseudouridine38-40 synthase
MLRKRQAEDAAGGERPKRPKKPEEKHRCFAVFIGYLGNGYFGMQKQLDAHGQEAVKTIEGEFEKALVASGWLDPVLLEDSASLNWSRSARTDKGVHAVFNVVGCNLKESEQVSSRITALNKLLEGQGIRAFFAHKVTARFDARMQCDRRRYEYLIPHTFPTASSLQFPEDFRAKLNSALSVFVGTHNFHNFTSGIRPEDPSVNRLIYSASIREVVGYEDTHVKLVIEGQSFLLNQIRKIVASVIEVLLGKIDEDELRSYLKPEVRRNLRMAPGEGLLLDRLHFDGYDKYKCNYKDMLPIEWSITENKDVVESFKQGVVYPEVTGCLPRIFEKWARENFIENYTKNFEAPAEDSLDVR